MNTKRYTVFLSSTFKDLEVYRESIHNAILSDGNFPLAMENFVSSNQPQWKTIKPLIDECDYYILIIGFRYGSIEDESGLSYTEKEYEYAKSIEKPILSFILDESFELDKDSDLMKIESFRKKVLSNGKLSKLCKDKYNLSSDIITSLHKEIIDSPQNGWIKSTSETHIGLSLNQIDAQLNVDEKAILKLFEVKDVKSITFNEFMKTLKLSQQQFQYYIEHLEEMQLLYNDSDYESDDTNYCELLPDGRKYVIKLLNNKVLI